MNTLPTFRDYATVTTEAQSGEQVDVLVPYQNQDIPISFILSADGIPYVTAPEQVNWHLTTVPLAHKLAWDVTVYAGPKPAHGGARAGAGRKTNAVHGLPTTVKRSVSLSPEVHAYVLQQQRPGEAYSATISRLLAALDTDTQRRTDTQDGR